MFQTDKHFIDRVTVYRKFYTQDTFGGSQFQQKLVGSNVSARLYSKSGAIRTDNTGKEYRPTHRLMAAYDVDIEADDMVEDQRGTKYQVLSRARRRIGSKLSHTECSLIEVAG
jgi:hypothetical protein